METYIEAGTILEACRRLHLASARIYEWRDADPEFANAIEEARAMAIARLRGEAHRRALKKSDTMLMFLLKRLDPELKDQPKRLEVTNTDREGLAINAPTVDVTQLSDEVLEIYDRLLTELKKMKLAELAGPRAALAAINPSR